MSVNRPPDHFTQLDEHFWTGVGLIKDSFTRFRHYQRSDGSGGPHGGQVNDVGGYLRLAPVLEEVDVEVDGAV